MAIKIAPQGGRLRRDNPVDRSAKSIRVGSAEFDKLFSTRRLIATASDSINYGQLDQMVNNFTRTVQQLEDDRVTVQNKKISLDIGKEIDQKKLEILSDPYSSVDDYVKAKEKVEKDVKKKALKYKNAPSRQYDRLITENLGPQLENFRRDLATGYLQKKQQLITQQTLDNLDNDNDNLSKSETLTELGNLYNQQNNTYNIKSPFSPFKVLTNYGISDDDQINLKLTHAATAIKHAATLLLTEDEGDAGKKYRESDAKVYYNQEDYTQLKNYISDVENQQKIADALGLNINRPSDKMLFESTISLLNNQIKEQTPFIKEENEIFNNDITNKIMKLVSEGKGKEAQELLTDNPYRGKNSSKNLQNMMTWLEKDDVGLALSHRVNIKLIVTHVLANPDKKFSMFSVIPGLTGVDGQDINVIQALQENKISQENALFYNNFVQSDPGQKALLATQLKGKEDAYKAVRPIIETALTNINKFSDAAYETVKQNWDKAYAEGIKNNIPHSDLLDVTTDTLHGRDTGNKKSIFFGAKNLRPSTGQSREDINSSYEQISDEKILSTPGAKLYIQLITTGDDNGKIYAPQEAKEKYILHFGEVDNNVNATINAIQNAYRRAQEKIESEED